jgi:hypothetical protein
VTCASTATCPCPGLNRLCVANGATKGRALCACRARLGSRRVTLFVLHSAADACDGDRMSSRGVARGRCNSAGDPFPGGASVIWTRAPPYARTCPALPCPGLVHGRRQEFVSGHVLGALPVGETLVLPLPARAPGCSVACRGAASGRTDAVAVSSRTVASFF